MPQNNVQQELWTLATEKAWAREEELWAICKECMHQTSKFENMNGSLTQFKLEKYMDRRVDFSRSLSSVIESERRSCTLCSLVLERLAKNIMEFDYPTALPEVLKPNLYSAELSSYEVRYSMRSTAPEVIQVLVGLSTDIFRGLSEDMRMLVEQCSRKSHWFGFPGARLEFDIVAPSGESLSARQISGRRVNQNTAGNQSFDMIKGCLEQCLRECTSCAIQCRPGQGPGRLVDLSAEHYLKLESHQKSRNVPYAALSYCWGVATQPQATCKANIEARRTGFESGDMPQTIQDAIFVARRLGVKYLWVDSLCIIQDCKSDKRQEISKMKDIFTGALFTIVAASAKSVTEGFLKKRELRRGLVSRIPFWMEDLSISAVQLVERDPILQQGDWTDRDPVHFRAWTLEEWLLSQRIVCYTREQCYWKCQRFEKIDGGSAPVGVPDIPCLLNNSDEIDIYAALRGPKALRPDKNGLSSVTIRWLSWEYILKEYTRRTLTHPRDKLVALDGVAAKFGQEWGLSYVAGLWEEDFVAWLMWKRLRHDQEALPNSITTTNSPPFYSYEPRSAHNPFPTWSWASVSFPVSQACSPINEPRYLTRLIEVREVKETTTNVSELVMDGPMVYPLEITEMRSSYAKGDGLYPLRLNIENIGNLDVKVSLDSNELPQLKASAVGFLLLSSDATYISGLILALSNEYRSRSHRIGMFRIEIENQAGDSATNTSTNPRNLETSIPWQQIVIL